MARQLGMKRAQADTPEAERRKEGVLHGMLVLTLGAIWLAQEVGIIATGLPIGPIIIIAMGFIMILPWLKK
jgi:hypothetical protein